MPSNVEIKARVHDADRLLSKVREISDSPDATELLQEDTFFNVPNGRLKLREIKNEPTAMLIYYDRPDTSGPKLSKYHHIPVANPAELKMVLGLAVGTKGVVRKRRQLFMVGQTRVHVDCVEKLGNFMELEVVLDESQTAADGQRIADELMQKLAIDSSDLLTGAYMDMLLVGSGESAIS